MRGRLSVLAGLSFLVLALGTVARAQEPSPEPPATGADPGANTGANTGPATDDEAIAEPGRHTGPESGADAEGGAESGGDAEPPAAADDGSAGEVESGAPTAEPPSAEPPSVEPPSAEPTYFDPEELTGYEPPEYAPAELLPALRGYSPPPPSTLLRPLALPTEADAGVAELDAGVPVEAPSEADDAGSPESGEEAPAEGAESTSAADGAESGEGARAANAASADAPASDVRDEIRSTRDELAELVRNVERPAPQTIVQPVIQGSDDELSALGEELTTFLDALDTDRSFGAVIVLALLLLLSILLAGVLRRGAGRLAPRGLLPSLFRGGNLLLRTLALVFFVFLILQLLPDRLAFALLLAVGGFAVAVGWSFGDVLPDFVAGVVLLFESRIRRGAWITGEGYGGQVESFDLRSTHLRDAQGHRVAVPNRRVLASPFTIDRSHEREQEVELILPDGSAAHIRQALRDAVVSSPWVFPGAEPIVLRDPKDPRRWRVRGRLLEAHFGGRFEGELLERVEEALERAEELELQNALDAHERAPEDAEP